MTTKTLPRIEEQKIDSITFLQCKAPLYLTKVWRKDHLQDYDAAKHFKVMVKPVSDLLTLAALLDTAMTKPRFAVIRGAPRENFDDRTDITRTLTNFNDAPRRWVMFDIDAFVPDVPPLEDPEAGVSQWIHTVLPPPFYNAMTYWQLSASAGHASRDPLALRAHVWFWLDTPITGMQWKRWAERLNLKIDKSVLSPVQLHYTAGPVIAQGADPYTKRSGMITGLPEVATADCKFGARAKNELPMNDYGDQVLKDPRLAPGLIGEFNSKVSILDAVTDLLPNVFEFVTDETGQWDGRRLNFLQGSGGTGGAFIHSDGMHLVNMQNHAPHGTQGKALNTFDLVRVYLYGDLDPTDPFLRLDVSSMPSHKEMLKLAKDKVQETTSDTPQAHQDDLSQVPTGEDVETPSHKVKTPPAHFPKPYPGVMKAMVDAALKSATIPQPELTLMGVLIGMAGGCGGHYHLPSGMRLNLYGLCISGTATGKEHVRQITTRMTEAAKSMVFGCPASGPGLQDALPDGGGCLIEIDEAAHLFANLNAKNAAPHTIDLARELLRLFSAGFGAYRTRLKAQGRSTVPGRTIMHPAMSFFGVTTAERFSTSVTVDNMTDGLIGRFMFAKGIDHAPGKWGAPAFNLPALVELAGSKLAWAPSLDRPVVHAHDVAPTMQQWFQEYRSIKTMAGESFAVAFSSRAVEKVERIAGVLAVWENPEAPVVTMGHINWARQFVDASNAIVLTFMRDELGGLDDEMKETYRVLDRIKRMTVDAKGPVRTNHVARALRMSKKKFESALDNLVGQDMIEISVDKGRTKPSKMVHLTPTGHVV